MGRASYLDFSSPGMIADQSMLGRFDIYNKEMGNGCRSAHQASWDSSRIVLFVRSVESGLFVQSCGFSPEVGEFEARALTRPVAWKLINHLSFIRRSTLKRLY